MTPHPTYQCLLPLRCLLLKESNPDKWNKLLELQAQDGNEDSEQSKLDSEGIVKFIPR